MSYADKLKSKSTVTCALCREETSDYVLGIPKYGKPKWICRKHAPTKEASK